MSRIGKQPVVLPQGVEASFAADHTLTISGPKGSLSQRVDPRITVSVEPAQKEVRFTRSSDQGVERALHGLYRALAASMVVGVTKGYAKRLEVHGVGYQALVKAPLLSLTVGFSKPVDLTIPKGITVICPNNTTIDVTGIDKQLVGQFASMIRYARPAEPYKGKGVRYAGEQIRRKAGKSMATGG